MAHHHGMEPLATMAAQGETEHQPAREDRFGRMFPGLPGAVVSDQVIDVLGNPGGAMDSRNRDKNSRTVPAGQVIFGQFVDHDITFDTTSTFEDVNDPNAINNVRTPTLDLDCIYGAGPEAQPYLYSQSKPFNGVKLLTGADMPDPSPLQNQDLLRAPTGRAIIGDPRNDENGVIAQMQLAMIRFHNQTAERLHEETPSLEGHDLFVEARRVTRWHYQWVVVNDFLVSMCGRPAVDRALASRHVYKPDVPAIPIEFAVAAYRFGHSMVPMSLRVQETGKRHELFGPILGNGFSPLSSEQAVVEWGALFPLPDDDRFERADRLDTLLASDLLDLPFIEAPDERSLAKRNLLRSNSFRLPGGDKVAKAMGRPDKEIETVMRLIGRMTDRLITEDAPLWLYLLAEGEEVGRETREDKFDKGEGLGPVGAQIVAEVLVGLLELDPRSYLAVEPGFKPSAQFDTVGKILVSTELATGVEAAPGRRRSAPAK